MLLLWLFFFFKSLRYHELRAPPVYQLAKYADLTFTIYRSIAKVVWVDRIGRDKGREREKGWGGV